MENETKEFFKEKCKDFGGSFYDNNGGVQCTLFLPNGEIHLHKSPLNPEYLRFSFLRQLDGMDIKKEESKTGIDNFFDRTFGKLKR